MSFVWAGLATVAVAGLAIGALLHVRRTAPDVFLAFESFDESRSGAETEAVLVAQQCQTAQFMPTAVRTDLADGVVCYGRSVVRLEWPKMRAGTAGAGLNPEQSAFDRWLDETSDRESARKSP
jgi:hypothetical protein